MLNEEELWQRMDEILPWYFEVLEATVANTITKEELGEFLLHLVRVDRFVESLVGYLDEPSLRLAFAHQNLRHMFIMAMNLRGFDSLHEVMGYWDRLSASAANEGASSN